MGTRYYRFFAIIRLAQKQKQLEITASGNKTVQKVLRLLRDQGLIAGFTLDANQWKGYPNYKVFLKYNFYGSPVIKRIDCYKATKTNYYLVKEMFPKTAFNNIYIVLNPNNGINILTNLKSNNSKIIARIQL